MQSKLTPAQQRMVDIYVASMLPDQEMVILRPRDVDSRAWLRALRSAAWRRGLVLLVGRGKASKNMTQITVRTPDQLTNAELTADQRRRLHMPAKSRGDVVGQRQRQRSTKIAAYTHAINLLIENPPDTSLRAQATIDRLVAELRRHVDQLEGRNV